MNHSLDQNQIEWDVLSFIKLIFDLKEPKCFFPIISRGHSGKLVPIINKICFTHPDESKEL